jgi:hypothetical protein
MRIISPFKDYYDGLQRLDTDHETQFRRKTQRDVIYSGILWATETVQVIGFAGKVYPFQIIKRDGRTIHNFDVDQWEKGRARWTRSGFLTTDIVGRTMLGLNGTPALEELFVKYGPIWLLYHDDVTMIRINPKLEPLGFASVVPPHEAYNELYKWIVNQARPNRPIPEMSNDIKIEQAGFDLKKSFRHKK